MLEFILARYNYWIVIILMMAGLYIVFSRGNLVKTIIGLNIFQTSVFIFYITLGKVIGGTAPILVEGAADAGHGAGHDDGHGPGHGQGHGTHHAEVAPGEIAPLTEVDAEALINRPSADGAQAVEGAHDDHDADHAHSTDHHSADHHTEIIHGADDHGGHGAGEGAASSDAFFADGIGEIVYSNPLPHVLILTAIVVGVATTAVGLALAVRIREAYGTIEEDTLEEMNHWAEFGQAPGEAGGAASGKKARAA